MLPVACFILFAEKRKRKRKRKGKRHPNIEKRKKLVVLVPFSPVGSFFNVNAVSSSGEKENLTASIIIMMRAII